MILWKSKIIKENIPAFPDVGLREWRWISEVTKYSAGIWRQIKFHDSEWHYASCPYYYVTINRWFTLGSSHDYYDGPHCTFNIGYLHFCYAGLPWNDYWCKKCKPDENE